ncbi:MAG: hypothetical protein B7X48_13555 [Acidiphilium sp. 34-60-192]|nr:MAG: hypothetical protein B7X48_13555 [Acidiphilium sp. 34-60-192]
MLAVDEGRVAHFGRSLAVFALSGRHVWGVCRRAKQHGVPRAHIASAILASLRSTRIDCSDETSKQINGRTIWNWLFQNNEVVTYVIRPGRGADDTLKFMIACSPSSTTPNIAEDNNGPECELRPTATYR